MPIHNAELLGQLETRSAAEAAAVGQKLLSVLAEIEEISAELERIGAGSATDEIAAGADMILRAVAAAIETRAAARIAEKALQAA